MIELYTHFVFYSNNRSELLLGRAFALLIEGRDKGVPGKRRAFDSDGVLTHAKKA